MENALDSSIKKYEVVKRSLENVSVSFNQISASVVVRVNDGFNAMKLDPHDYNRAFSENVLWVMRESVEEEPITDWTLDPHRDRLHLTNKKNGLDAILLHKNVISLPIPAAGRNHTRREAWCQPSLAIQGKDLLGESDLSGLQVVITWELYQRKLLFTAWLPAGEGHAPSGAKPIMRLPLLSTKEDIRNLKFDSNSGAKPNYIEPNKIYDSKIHNLSRGDVADGGILS